MRRAVMILTAAATVIVAVLLAANSAFSQPMDCAVFHINAHASQALTPVDLAAIKPGQCHFRRAANGMALPDPACTPGAINPTVSASVLRDPRFRTECVRNQVSSATRKRQVYAWYGVFPPANNATGPGQACELDHLVSIELGGSDDLSNIWPQCGPAGASLDQREFKIKDRIAERSLAEKVRGGADLKDVQARIANDWTQFNSGP